MIWFTADWHLDHANVIQHSQRPDANVEAMNDRLIDNCNEKVEPTDTLYHLGDVAFCRNLGRIETLMHRIHCKNIILILGNHDDQTTGGQPKKAWLESATFREVYNTAVLRPVIPGIGKTMITLCHYPMATWRNQNHGSWHLHGHCHGTLKHRLKYAMDVGVDTNNGFPYSLDNVAYKLVYGGWKV
tara:strand:- start:271 stop:828 length:558 start_codon:yes stop_codon:yes gene_type:complete